MNPPRVPPTPSESEKIRKASEIAALTALPGTPSFFRQWLMGDVVRKALLGSTLQQQKDNVRELFDLLGMKECNKHLLMFMLDLIVVRLIPELAEQTPKELFDLRTS